jgi:hypothetical protein
MVGRGATTDVTAGKPQGYSTATSSSAAGRPAGVGRHWPVDEMRSLMVADWYPGGRATSLIAAVYKHILATGLTPNPHLLTR